MSDYQRDLDRFMDAWEQVQQDLRAREQLQQLADRQGISVEELQARLDRIDAQLREIAGPWRPTRTELIEHALKHGSRRD